MATMNISLPDPIKGWVEEQARSGRYDDAGDYVRELIERERERVEKIAKMQALIDEGLASGVSDRTVDEIYAEARAEWERELQT